MRTFERFGRLSARAARRRLAMVTTAILASTSPALATNFSWDSGSATSNWYDGLNWNPNGIPDAASVVTFPDLGANVFVGSNNTPLEFNASSVTISCPNLLQIFSNFSSTTLTLATGDVTRTAASAGFHTITVPVVLNANGVWNINGTGELSVAAIREGVAGLSFTKNGTGMLSITGNSNYTGATNVNAGFLQVGASGLGAGAVTVASGATLGPTSTATINHAITITGTGAGGIGALYSEDGSTGWSGAITLASNSSIGVAAGAFTISGLIDDGAFTRTLTKVGAGTLMLSHANTYGGGTTVSEGILWLNNATAANNTDITVASGASLTPGNNLTFTNHAFLNGTGAFDEGAMHNQTGLATWSGIITLQSNSSVGSAAGELLITGGINGASNLTKVGAGGTVTLAASNSFTGTLTVAEGTVKIRNPFASSSTGTTVSAGATLAVQETIASAAITISRPISLNGAGVDSAGALRNLSSNNTWNGAVTLQSNSRVGVDADQFTISGVISGAFNLTKVGLGTLVISNSGNSYGNTIVNEGFLLMTNAAAFPAAGNITVHDGGTLRFQSNNTGIRPLQLNGIGQDGAGAVDSISGTNQWTASVTLQSDSRIAVDSGELRLPATVTGAGGIEKTGLGKLTLLAANTYTGTTLVNSGILSVEHSSALPGTLTTVATGAAVEVRGGVAPTGPLALSDTGILNTGALRNPAGTNTWAGPITLQSGDAAIGADATTQLTISSVIGDGPSVFPLTKVGSGMLVLSNANTYKGGTIINGGILSVAADNNLGLASGAVTTNNGGKLLVTSNMASGRTFNLNTGSLQVGAAATLTYTTATVNGGFLRGPGTHAIGLNSSFSGVTALNGTNITQSQPTTLVNFTNAGNLTSSAALTWDGGFNTSSGIITVNNSFATQGFENDGVITVASGGSITNTTSSLVSGGGGRITVNTGGTINAGPSFELNGSLLVNNGIVSGTTNVNYGSLAKGSGNYGAVNVTDGGRFSPGNSPGSVTTGPATWNSGGNYLVEVGDVLGNAGEGWDLWLIDGQLSVNATSTSNGRFTVSLASLDDLVFDASRDYTWPILDADGGIVGLDLSELAIDTSAFKQSLSGGHFSLQSTPTELAVHFSAVPEPGLLAASLLIPLITLRRRRNS